MHINWLINILYFQLDEAEKEQFILAVEQKQELWDPKQEEYKNTRKKEDIWAAMSLQFDLENGK